MTGTMDVEGILPISAIEHFAYCPRQAALIHVDGQWSANAHTAQGEAEHAAIDRASRGTTRDGIPAWYSLPVWHDELGLYGVCDVVEIADGRPTPVEQKPTLGRWVHGPAAQQLAAQALCLETMWDCSVSHGVIFTRRDRRRHVIEIDDGLRRATIETIVALQKVLASSRLPAVVDDGRCDHCSLRDVCKGTTPVRIEDPFTAAPEGGW